MDALLRQVFRDVGATVNFVQLYSTTPHCHRSPALKHPISRVISMCDLHIEKHRKMLASNASKYVAHMEDLAQKMVARDRLRLEAVFLVTPEFPKSRPIFRPIDGGLPFGDCTDGCLVQGQ